ncbi:hypothetical protein GCM10009844_43530 [Nocardioides koreensis]|uniref:Response regulatory domain-containing protein n=1 Tax=Nocardioides koreensis TaxID=433651 RepID=A0ABN3A8M5_9ACTN
MLLLDGAAGVTSLVSGVVDRVVARRREMARVMVVDEDVTVREVVTSYLRADRHEAVESGDGEEALRMYRDRPVDLVVLDLALPGIDGREVPGDCARSATCPSSCSVRSAGNGIVWPA